MSTQTKMIEVRDKGILSLMLAIRCLRCSHNDDAESWLLKRGGFGADSPYILLAEVNGSAPYTLTYDEYHWDERTHKVAHKYLIENWSSVQSGDVIDVQYILGETSHPKVSERLS